MDEEPFGLFRGILYMLCGWIILGLVLLFTGFLAGWWQ
jgi:hypothetical protein